MICIYACICAWLHHDACYRANNEQDRHDICKCILMYLYVLVHTNYLVAKASFQKRHQSCGSMSLNIRIK